MEAENSEKIISQEIEEEMKKSYMDYAMSVIVGRALPDVRDGLKPVHRRVLYTMHTTGVFHNKPYRKSANVVGNCMAKFHPHGDASIYDTLVRMTQPFSLRYMLIDGQGNFGSIDGDSAAAMRYTEARMAPLAEEMLEDIDKETVKFMDNFDSSTKEPTVLPSKIPQLLINGTAGIAVGMATNMPPHNLNEVSDAICAMIDNQDITIQELMNYVKAPDFPTSGLLQGTAGVKAAYMTGRGRAIVRCKHHMEERKRGGEQIVITEIPYQVNKALLLENIAHLVKEKRIEGITDIRDESDRTGMRIVLEIKNGTNETVLLNQLYKHTRLQDSFAINMLALVDNEPKTLNLKELIHNFIQHRKVIVTKRTEYNLMKAKEKAHILEGLLIALKNIDEIIEKIKKSRDPKEAGETLMQDYSLSERQAKVILEMRLQKLSSMEREKIRTDYDETMKLIQELEAILSDEQKIYGIIKEETQEIKRRYGDERRTEIIDVVDNYNPDIEDLIEREDMIVSITHQGYIKRLQTDTYREQKRGGKGVIATGKKEEDFVEDLFIANTHDYLLFFTNKGNLFWLKVYRLPFANRQSRGSAIVNLINLAKDERVNAILPISSFDDKYVLMCTRKGIIKKVQANHFSRPRKTGIIAIYLTERDELIGASITEGDKEVMIATRKGKAVRFKETDVRPVGRTARGVSAIRLVKDEVIGMIIGDETKTILSVTEKGYGKRTELSEYRLIKRGGSGVRNMLVTEKTGKVVSINSVTPDDSIVLISQQGLAIRTSMENIPVIGRNTQGVKLMRLSADDKIVTTAKVAK
ncbi:MAG: DNA gyrase subunit A [Candidatus Woesearchaeota archaeon]